MREMGYQSSKKNSQQPKEFRGGEKKVMKKRLALLLSVAMAFSMFANVAFGASSDLTTTQKYDALVKEGIFTGIAGSNDPQLNATTTRAQFAKVLALTLGLEPVNTGSSFKDQNYDKHWAKPYVEALVKENLITGYADGKFHFNDTVTGEQMAKTFGAALGLEEVKDAAAIEGVSKWAYGWVQAVKDAGFDWSENGKWNVPAKRATLVEASYDVREQTSVQVESAKALDEKTVEVKFTDGETKKVTLDKALVEGQETAVKVEHKGKTYEVKVTLQALAIEGKVTGAKTLQVTFNRTVDTSAVKLAVKRGSSDIAIAKDGVKFSDDKLSAQITLNNKLSQGEYTINLTNGDKVVSAKVTAEVEKVTKIELLGETASVDKDYKKLSVGFKVLNQYGEDASNLANLSWSASKGKDPVAKNGVVTFSSDQQYIYNEPVVIMVHDTNNGIVANKTYKVGLPAKATTVEFKGIYNIDNNELTSTTNTAKDEFYILVDVKDQYGNIVNEDMNNNVIVTSTNPMIMGVSDKLISKVGPKNDSWGIKLESPDENVFRQAGSVDINVITFGNGQTSTYKLEVKQGAELKTFRLMQPEDEIAAGDGWVKIPFEAYDQNGDAITSYRELKKAQADRALTFNLDEAELKFVEDAKTGKATLEYNAQGQRTVVVYATVVKHGASSSVTFQVKKEEDAKPVEVKGLVDDFTTAYTVGSKAELKGSSFNFVDKLGRTLNATKLYDKEYKVGIVGVKGLSQDVFSHNITPNATPNKEGDNQDFVFDTKDTVLNLSALERGTLTMTVALYDKTLTKVDNSEQTINLRVVNVGNISKYQVDDLGMLYAGTDDTFGEDKEEIKVYGVLGNAEKVKLTYGKDYTVVGNSSLIAVDQTNGNVTKALNAEAVVGSNNTVETTLKINVIGDDYTPTTIEKTLKVSTKKPIIEKIAGKKDESVFKVTYDAEKKSADLWSFLSNVEAKTQYGTKIDAYDLDRTKVNFLVSKVLDAGGYQVQNFTISGSEIKNVNKGYRVFVTVTADEGSANFVINLD